MRKPNKPGANIDQPDDPAADDDALKLWAENVIRLTESPELRKFYQKYGDPARTGSLFLHRREYQRKVIEGVSPGRPPGRVSRDDPDVLPGQVKAAIIEMLQRGDEPLRKTIARKLLRSESDLKQKLAACKTTFKSLKAECIEAFENGNRIDVSAVKRTN